MHAVFVLACGAKNGKLTRESRIRVKKAVEVFKDLMVVSGGQKTKRNGREITEAELMKEYAISLGIPSSKIILDFSIDTIQSILSLKKFLSKSMKMTVVTSNFHKERVKMLCKFFNGVEVIGVGSKKSTKIENREKKLISITKALLSNNLRSLKRAVVLSSIFFLMSEANFVKLKLP